MNNYTTLPYHAILELSTMKILKEHSSRKYLRRVARKKYTKSYRDTIAIISGEDKKNAMQNYKLALKKEEEEKTTPKPKAQVKKTAKPKAKQAKPKAKQAKAKISEDSMLKKNIAEEKKAVRKLNARNKKLAN